MSSLFSCSLTLRLHLSHCSFDSCPLFLGEALPAPLVSPSSYSPLSLSPSLSLSLSLYIYRYYFLFFPVKQRPVSHLSFYLSIHTHTHIHTVNIIVYLIFWYWQNRLRPEFRLNRLLVLVPVKPLWHFSFFHSWVSKTQPIHWTKRMANTRLATEDPRTCPGLEDRIIT